MAAPCPLPNANSAFPAARFLPMEDGGIMFCYWNQDGLHIDSWIAREIAADRVRLYRGGNRYEMHAVTDAGDVYLLTILLDPEAIYALRGYGGPSVRESIVQNLEEDETAAQVDAEWRAQNATVEVAGGDGQPPAPPAPPGGGAILTAPHLPPEEDSGAALGVWAVAEALAVPLTLPSTPETQDTWSWAQAAPALPLTQTLEADLLAAALLGLGAAGMNRERFDSLVYASTIRYPETSPRDRVLASPQKRVADIVIKDAVASGASCPISMEELTLKTAAAVAPCYHVFEREAIKEWLEHSETCPTCREPCQM